ncbi:MAG TPA: ATP-grasp domain-containing protein [Methanoregula sp.]|nr:ATP-grasp domain-containing protein [Methanoregula sp.]
MKILLAEYATTCDPALAPEGAAMLGVLKTSFERCGHEAVLPGSGDFGGEIERIAPSCDMGLVIAPDHLLPRYTMILEQHTHNLGCGFISAALCANKVRTAKILSSHGIPVPEECTGGTCVVKPVTGCGAQGVRLSSLPPGNGEFSQRFIEGEHLSVSIVAGRVTGEACLYFTGNPPLALAVNRQEIEIAADGSFRYLGGETPVHPGREAEISGIAAKTVTVLGCQGYCGVDVVVADRIYVVDVNPRITTSLVGIAACMNEEIAEILIAASKGEAVGPVHLAGRARFDTRGQVTKL